MVEINTGLTALSTSASDRPRSSDGGSRGRLAVNDTLTEATSSAEDDNQTEIAVAPSDNAAEVAANNRGASESLRNTRLRINQDTATGLFVYQSLDRETEEVVRQFPPEDILKFIAFYREQEAKEDDDGSKVDETV